MINDLEELDDLGDRLCETARRRGVFLIWRAQSLIARHVSVRKGRIENTGRSVSSGHGMHVVDDRGYPALSSVDGFDPEEAEKLLASTIEATLHGESLGLSTATLSDLEPHHGREIPVGDEAFAAIDQHHIGRRLLELESELQGRVEGVSLQLSYRAELDAWRIRRSDTTDVLYAMPRCLLSLRATNQGDDGRHGVSTNVFSSHPDLIDDETALEQFLTRGMAAARLATRLPGAPHHPAGCFPLVIDYALAKGLAHEAFGHASESDGFRASILARNGRFRQGQKVGPSHVSIIDEPQPNDHAWQPFSSNGLPRERAVLVKDGRLRDGLSDLWSYAAGGVRLTGAARAQSYGSAPLPRMTNIRIECAAPLPAAGRFEDYGPEEVRDLLAGAGVFRRHPQVCFLSGYTGGQVNTTAGEFVFNCRAIYTLSPDSIRLHKPAIFSGSMFGALESIREAFGPLRLDAIGFCGKWGQHVPSSGGSHYFLVLDPHPDVHIGGS